MPARGGACWTRPAPPSCFLAPPDPTSFLGLEVPAAVREDVVWGPRGRLARVWRLCGRDSHGPELFTGAGSCTHNAPLVIGFVLTGFRP